jgi:peroxiredoxin Q/BCP
MSIRRSFFAALLSVAGLAHATDLSEGTKAPYFEAQDQHGKTVRLSDFNGKANIVLYFYPKDDTPGCTAQACSLRDGLGAIQAAGAIVLGVSADDASSHQAFSMKYSLPFSLLADPKRAIIEAYGVKMPVLGIAKRVTFIIDKQGLVRRILRDVDTKHHDQQVLEILKTLA